MNRPDRPRTIEAINGSPGLIALGASLVTGQGIFLMGRPGAWCLFPKAREVPGTDKGMIGS
jgi:hypothetical protein